MVPPYDGVDMVVVAMVCSSGIEWYVVKCLMIIFISILHHHHQLVKSPTPRRKTPLNPSTDISTSCIYYSSYRVYGYKVMVVVAVVAMI